MSSSRSIDFRLRANKGIERAIAFETLADLGRFLGPDPVYVGLGSLWFVDFRMAHRLLGIETMISIEGNETIASRAEFNKPYGSIEIVQGYTYDVLDELRERDDLASRPWIVWLDYDSELSEQRLEELHDLAVELPDGSAILTTFNTQAHRYGNFDNRLAVIRDLFGEDVVGSEVDPDDLTKANFGAVVTRCMLSYLESAVIRSGREGSFIPTTSLRYVDTAPMATIGGVLAASDLVDDCREVTEAAAWPGRDDMQIASEPLTMREIEALCTLLPAKGPLKPSDVRKLGFELEPDQIALFQRHYLRYPSFAEIVS